MAMQVKTEEVDRLSDLHDSILSHILSFLSTKQAVGTSVLSTRWRYLFTLLSNLHFDDDSCRNDLQFDDSCRKSFMCFLDRVLFSRKTSLDEFRLRRKGRVCCSRIHGWISAAVSCGVKHLDLNITSHDDFTLPDVLFTCTTLETLNLAMNFHFVLDVPDHVRLPNLKTLHVKSAKFLNDDSLKRFFSSCTSLEELVLESCVMENIIKNFSISHRFLKRLTIIQTLDSFDIHELMIEASNLAYFKYFDELLSSYSLENLESLVKADISSYRYLQPDASAATLFRGIRHVRSLILSTTSLELLSSCESLPSFATLVKLKICYSFGWSSSMDKGLGVLLSSSPELERLDFDKVFLCSVPERVLSSLLLKFKAMEISGFVDNADCIGKAKYILMNGGALEKLTIYTAANISAGKKLEISEVLMASPRKSKQCIVLIV